MSTTSATATTEGKMVMFIGDKGGCVPKGWCRPSRCQWPHICPAWNATVQHHSQVTCQCGPASAQANIQWLISTTKKWSYLMWNEDSRSWPRALLWEQSVRGSRRKGGRWVPLDGICVPGHTYSTGHFIFCLCLSPLSPLKPHPRTFTSF